ncbi:MAG: CHC2 zinc finger domain-containing protein, partial [Parvularculaceae bacterium]
MPRFTPEFLDELRARVRVSDVVGRSVKLQKRGNAFWGLSPFKKEKTPSFTVDDNRQSYHCFSTGQHGDIIRFLMETKGLSFPEAVEQLAADAGMELPRSSPEA